MTKGGHLVTRSRSQLWHGGRSAPRIPHPIVLAQQERGWCPCFSPVLRLSLLPSPPCLSCFLSAQGRHSSLGSCLCVRRCLPGASPGYRLALRPARDSGISSGMARLGQALFWGSRCLGFLTSFPRDRDDQLGLGVASILLETEQPCRAGTAGAGLGSPAPAARNCCPSSCAGFSFPLALWCGSAPRQVEGCRQGWRGPTQNLHLCFFPHWVSDHLVAGWLR